MAEVQTESFKGKVALVTGGSRGSERASSADSLRTAPRLRSLIQPQKTGLCDLYAKSNLREAKYYP
jgi:hypothetical protein